MGQYSWFTQDTHHRIINDEEYTVIMSDDKGNKYEEHCYDGYGVFGGKDYYELLAEMNGYSIDDFNGDKEALRWKGIELAHDGHPYGDNPNVKHPSLTESGVYWNGKAPERDPDQGFDPFLWDDDEF